MHISVKRRHIKIIAVLGFANMCLKPMDGERPGLDTFGSLKTLFLLVSTVFRLVTTNMLALGNGAVTAFVPEKGP